MKIESIDCGLNFKAGKVQVYSDFDGTYCPAKHSSLHIEGENLHMPEYCAEMDKFFKSTNGDIHFHITTGRTFGEFEAIFHLLKMRNFRLPLPESFISKNGSDEFIKNGSDLNFYDKGIFPYKYTEPNLAKENAIKAITNWDGSKIKDFIKTLADRYKLPIIEAYSENSVNDYGENSLFSDGKLNADEWRKLPSRDGRIIEHNPPIANYVLGARKDGKLKINLIFSPDYGYCSERNYIYDSFMNEIKEYLENNNIKYSMAWDVPSKHNHYRNHCNITPKINDLALTKVYDTKIALSEAIKNNDMVIVAGDGSNDFDMLNPLEYIEQKDWEKYKKNSKFKEFYDSDMHTKLKHIKEALNGHNEALKKEIETNGLITQIKEMPLYSIIVDKNNSKLKQIKETFARFGKIIEISNGDLDSGIKSAIKIHANSSMHFKNGMSQKFKEYILGVAKKKDYKALIIVLGAIITFLAGGLVYKKYKTESNNEIITSQQR